MYDLLWINSVSQFLAILFVRHKSLILRNMIIPKSSKMIGKAMALGKENIDTATKTPISLNLLNK